jgi:hypothetical protein
MLKFSGEPKQVIPLPVNSGVTETVETSGELPSLLALNKGIVPSPDVTARPINVLLFVH